MDYNTWKMQKMHELGGMPMSENEISYYNKNLPNLYKQEYIKQNGPVLTQNDAQNINRAFEMPTYKQIYNNILQMLNR